jgi:penicillin-binding protein 2
MTDNSRVRVSIVGVVVIALFCALLARLWFLQVGSADTYVTAIEQHATRSVQTENARGRIFDRDGELLVENRVVWAITVDRELDDDARVAVLGRLSELLGEPSSTEVLQARVDDPRVSHLVPAIVAVDIPEDVRLAILEHREDFPGVDVTKLTVRAYPNGRVASHVLGYVGEISDEELAARGERGYVGGDTIGKAGVERTYESVLRGEPRTVTYEVDPTGRPVGDPVETDGGSVGDDVVLTLDLDVQRLVEDSLAQGIALARTQRNEDVEDSFERYRAPAGAAVVLDVRDGSVVAMASYPDYDPAQFIGGIPEALWQQLNDEANHTPLLNRATQGVYAPGSTFKLMTALAGLEFGFRSQWTTIEDRGSVEIGGRVFSNAGGTAHGSVDLRKAVRVSSDVYFYLLGREFWQTWKSGDTARGDGIQTVARRYGFGETSGIPLDESKGRVPDAAWKADFAAELHDDPEVARENAIWYPGDNVNLSIGQGDLVVTPLQLANAYAAFANGGTLFRPQVVERVVAPDGDVVEELEPEIRRATNLDPVTRGAILEGLRGAVGGEGGTAAGAFAGFPLDVVAVAGKTGTAQVRGKGDTSLFAGFFPATAPQYVVVTIIEEGGRGARVAAPVVRRIIEGMNGLTPGQVALADGVD